MDDPLLLAQLDERGLEPRTHGTTCARWTRRQRDRAHHVPDQAAGEPH
ncbi:hypothetical protein [Amycolatopsis minnesotensis]